MAQWAYRTGSAVTAGNASGGDLVINRPTGTANGDLIVIAVYFEPDTCNISITGGFTSALAQVNTGAFKLETFYRIASSEPTTYTISNDVPGNQWRAAVGVAYQNGTGSGPWEDVEGGSQGDAVLTGSQTAPSVTTSGVDRLLVFSYGNFSGSNVGGMAGAASNLRTSHGGCTIADAARASAGATGTSNPTGMGSEDYAATHTTFISDTGGAAAASLIFMPRPMAHMLVR